MSNPWLKFDFSRDDCEVNFQLYRGITGKNHNKMKEFQKLSTYNYLWHFAFILHFISLFSNIVCFTNLVYCSHTWPLWVNFFLYTLCITMELKFMLYSMLLDIVYYKITIGQNHNVHFIERRRTNSIILEYWKHLICRSIFW